MEVIMRSLLALLLCWIVGWGRKIFAHASLCRDDDACRTSARKARAANQVNRTASFIICDVIHRLDENARPRTCGSPPSPAVAPGEHQRNQRNEIEVSSSTKSSSLRMQFLPFSLVFVDDDDKQQHRHTQLLLPESSGDRP